MPKPTQVRRSQPAATILLTRRAPVRASSFDQATGAFEAVIATATPVLRRDYTGEYYEVLALNPKAVRLGRMQSGAAPILDTHRAGSASDQVGIVTDARIEKGQLITSARLSRRDDVKPIADDLAGGTPPNVSVGYRVYATEETTRADGARVLTRTDWEPYEMSFVAVPADPQTHVRSNKETNMPTDDILEVEDHAETETRSTEAPANRKMSDRHAVEAYRIAANGGLTADFVRQHIDNGMTLKEFRAVALNKRPADANELRVCARSGDGGDQTFDNPDFLGQAIGGALYARMSGKPAEGAARELMGRSLLDMGAMVLQARGERVSWSSRDALAGQIMTRDISGQHTTSDFPVLLTQSGNRVLLEAYKSAECPLKLLARVRSPADFRKLTTVKLSEAPILTKVREGGEVHYGSRSESKEAFSLETFARIFSITRQALINDDLNAFADTGAAWGRAAANAESDQIIALFAANAGAGVNLDDGNPIYTTVRGNKATAGAAINVTSLDAARQAMRGMKDLDGKTLISVTPKHLVVGPAKETEGQQFLAALQATQASNVNPFAGNMSLHVDPRLAGNAWRVFADPSELAVLNIAYLAGHEGPRLDQREGWTMLGWEFRAVMDFGCGIGDWRGTFLNPGN